MNEMAPRRTKSGRMKRSSLSRDVAAYSLTTTLLGLIAIGALAVRFRRLLAEPEPLLAPVRFRR